MKRTILTFRHSFIFQHGELYAYCARNRSQKSVFQATGPSGNGPHGVSPSHSLVLLLTHQRKQCFGFNARFDQAQPNPLPLNQSHHAKLHHIEPAPPLRPADAFRTPWTLTYTSNAVQGLSPLLTPAHKTTINIYTFSASPERLETTAYNIFIVQNGRNHPHCHVQGAERRRHSGCPGQVLIAKGQSNKGTSVF